MPKQNLLMIPGLVANDTMWLEPAKLLSDVAECHIARLPPLDDLAEMARLILLDAPERFALAGWSMGGYLAFEILRQAEKRVSRIALMSTNALPETRAVTLRRRIMNRDAGTKGYMTMIENIIPRFLHPDNVKTGVVAAVMSAQARETGYDAFLQHQNAMINRSDNRDVARNIKCPTVVMVGDQDIVTPISEHKELADLIPDARLVVVPTCGHMITLENPVATAGILRGWLLDRAQNLDVAA
jgi:pimeloyl-ACP methyl ester carboxylesterase